MIIKAMIGTLALIFLNNLGLICSMSNYSLTLKIIGFIDYFITILFLYFVVYHYMDSDFYRDLGEKT